jgi:hypothetical protein
MTLAIILMLILIYIAINADHNIVTLSNQIEELKKEILKMHKDNS